MRRLTMAAAAVVGAMGGGAVLGDDHMSGEHVDCSYVPWDCLDECLELKWCVAIPENDGMADCLSESLALAACEAGSGGGPGGGSGGGVIIIPGCPGGQHSHDGECHADHECGDDEIGGGDQDCEACPDGEVPNEDGTECVSEPFVKYKVARCERSLDAPYGDYLPANHPNVLVEKLNRIGSVVDSVQRGFFPAVGYDALAAAYAASYLISRLPGPPPPEPPAYVPSDVREDPIQGSCWYETSTNAGRPRVGRYNVTKDRYDTVKSRMLITVHNNPPAWHIYHAIVNNSIDWGNEVLK